MVEILWFAKNGLFFVKRLNGERRCGSQTPKAFLKFFSYVIKNVPYCHKTPIQALHTTVQI